IPQRRKPTRAAEAERDTAPEASAASPADSTELHAAGRKSRSISKASIFPTSSAGAPDAHRKDRAPAARADSKTSLVPCSAEDADVPRPRVLSPEPISNIR